MLGAAPAAPCVCMASGSARAVISSVVSSTFITTRCLSKRRVNEVPWFARVGELAARLSSDEATTTSTELGILLTSVVMSPEPHIWNRLELEPHIAPSPHICNANLQRTVSSHREFCELQPHITYCWVVCVSHPGTMQMSGGACAAPACAAGGAGKQAAGPLGASRAPAAVSTPSTARHYKKTVSWSLHRIALHEQPSGTFVVSLAQCDTDIDREGGRRR